MYWTLGANATPYTSLTVNGVPQFQAANAAAGIPQGTQFTPAWFTDVQGELINIPLSAGIAPAQNTPTQVLQGLRRIFGGNFTLIEASTTLTADQMGFIELEGSGEMVVGLPAPGNNLTPMNWVFNFTENAQTLFTESGVFLGPSGNSTNTLSIAAGELLLLRADPVNYVVAAVGLSAANFQFTESGSYWALTMPDGFIFQGGSDTMPTTGTSSSSKAITFIEAFGTACLGIAASAEGGSYGGADYPAMGTIGAPSRYGATIQADNLSSGVHDFTSAVPFNFIAWGK
jgi:hypothetical protein